VRVGSGGTHATAAAAVKPGNNKPCPCGSKKKYKNCCGIAVAAAARRQQSVGGTDVVGSGPGAACVQAADKMVAQIAALVI
jgi:hypothetical protein